MPPRCKPPEPTPEQLALALRQLWRPGWPADLEATLHHPIYGTCLRGLARNMRRPPMVAKPVPMLGTVHQAPPTPTEAPARTQRGCWRIPAGAFDAKRAAANDKDT